MLYVMEDIPFNFTALEHKAIESLFTEINLQNIKMLINYSYNPHEAEIKNI